MTTEGEILASLKLITDRLNLLFTVDPESDEMEIYVEPPLSTYDLVSMCLNAMTTLSYIDEDEQSKMSDVAMKRVNRTKKNLLRILDECMQAEAEILFEDKT